MLGVGCSHLLGQARSRCFARQHILSLLARTSQAPDHETLSTTVWGNVHLYGIQMAY